MQFEDTITVERSEDEIIKRKRKRIHYQDFVSGLESSDAGKKKQENVASTPKDSGVLSLPVPPKKVTCRTDYHTSQQLKPYSRSARSPHNKDRYSNPSQSRSRSNSGTHEQSPSYLAPYQNQPRSSSENRYSHPSQSRSRSNSGTHEQSPSFLEPYQNQPRSSSENRSERNYSSSRYHHSLSLHPLHPGVERERAGPSRVQSPILDQGQDHIQHLKQNHTVHRKRKTNFQCQKEDFIGHADDLYPAVKSLLLKLFLEAYILAHSVSGKASNGKNFAKPPFDSRLYGVMLSILKEKSLAHLQKI
ncbi:hypothetical protein GQR58_026447 [Nymphon striatum]|nr:hypothetical protein GQR58_026447 [Nymphon striatum]